MASVPDLGQTVGAIGAFRKATLLAPPFSLALVLHLFCIIVPVYLLATVCALHQMVLGASLAEPISGDVLVHRCRSPDDSDFPTLLTCLRLLRPVSLAVPHGHVLDVVFPVFLTLVRAGFVAVSAHARRVTALLAQVSAVFVAGVRWYMQGSLVAAASFPALARRVTTIEALPFVAYATASEELLQQNSRIFKHVFFRTALSTLKACLLSVFLL